MIRFVVAIIFSLLILHTVGFAQEQPAVNCATLEQCRILVMVARGQLLSAQDAWAFWAEKASKLQEQMDAVQKEAAKKGTGDTNAKSE